jgi:hypothetical protein
MQCMYIPGSYLVRWLCVGDDKGRHSEKDSMLATN